MSEIKQSYYVIDKYGNKYRCNYFQYGGKRHIYLGANFTEACVKLSVYDDPDDDDPYVSLDDAIYHQHCSFNGLKNGERGTHPMIISALCVAKHFFNLERYNFQDNSYFTNTRGEDVSLSDYYLLTHSKTWYERFLKIKPIHYSKVVPIIQRLKIKLCSVMDITYGELLAVYDITPSDVQDLHQLCNAKIAWTDFHSKLFKQSPNLLTKATFMKMLKYHLGTDVTEFTATTYSGVGWEGNFKNVSCDFVLRMGEAPWEPMGPFDNYSGSQIGGGPIIITRTRGLTLDD